MIVDADQCISEKMNSNVDRAMAQEECESTGNITSEVDFESYPDAEQSVALLVLWSFWFINIFLMLIIILNFLIAEVS
jgi:hypothetical protein